MLIKIDDETSIELKEDGLAVTGKEEWEERVRTVFVPYNSQARQAIDTLHKIVEAHTRADERDKLDGKQMPEPAQIWRHYKGTYYEVVNVAEHSESNDVLVLYREMKGDGNKVWARPLSMWHDDIGDGVPRFKFAEDEED